MWLRKLLSSFSKNKRPLKGIMGFVLGALTLTYPIALYFFHDHFSPLFFISILGGILLLRTALPFLLFPTTQKTTLEKNTFSLSMIVTASLGVLLFFKGESAALYYPVFMSLGMAGLFATSLFFPPTIIERFARLQTPNLSPSGLKYTRQVKKIWVGFILCNALISYMTITNNDLEIWALYNGLISYLLMGILLGGEFIFRSFYQKKKHRQAFENFTSLVDLLGKETSYWSTYWGIDFKNYTDHINALSLEISSSKTKRVFLISNDRTLFLKGFLAILKSQKTIVLPHTNTPDFLSNLLQSDDILLSDQEDLKELSPNFMSLTTIKTTDKVSLTTPIQDQKIIFYTSGSTGAPKAIYKTLSQLETEVRDLQKTWPLENSNTVFSMVPHHYLYGFIFSFLWPICAQTPLHCKTLQHWEELPKSDDHNAIVISSPAHVGRFPDPYKNTLQRIFSSGGPLSFDAATRTKKALGVLPTEVYGSTETGGIAYRQQHAKQSLWTPFPAVDIYVDQDSKLSVKSPYLETSDFYKTSDLALLKGPVQFSLQGRDDRIVKIEGKRICLIELEKKLGTLKEIQEAHTLLLETDKRQEVGAIIVLTSAGQQQLQTLGKIKFSRLLRAPLQSYFDLVTLPRRWRFVDGIPHNSQGKRPTALLKTLFEKRAA